MRSVTLLTTAAILLTPVSLGAETLQQALSRAYATNPTLAAQRSTVKAVDEDPTIALAAGRPSALGKLEYSENVLNDANVRNNFAAPDRQATGSVNVTVPLVAFGAVKNAVAAADSRVQAARSDLRGTEADLFTSVVGIYMDVIRDQQIVALNKQNVDILQFNLQASQDKFRVGAGNSTDVDQSRARLFLANSQLRTAQARLIVSREEYLRLVGSVPEGLEAPPPLPGLPDDLDQVVQIAIAENAKLASAKDRLTASRHDIDAARAEALPRLNAVGGINYYNYLSSLGSGIFPNVDQDGASASVGLSLQVPIYQGGRPAGQIRQAKAKYGTAMEQVTEAERGVISQARGSFAMWQAARDVIEASREGVKANQASLEGLRAQNAAGERSILDVLNGQQELLNTQITLVSAERDAYVAAFALMAAMGRAEADNLGLADGTPLYDPTLNYKETRKRIGDFDSTGLPKPVAPSTATLPAQNADVTAVSDPMLQIPKGVGQ